MLMKVELQKKKPNYFYFFDKKTHEYNEVKYLTQHELADGWQQVVSPVREKKLVNHFSVTLAFLPEHLWKRLKKVNSGGEMTYKIINNKITRYTIIETNQDETMINLFNELSGVSPNISLLNKHINDLDVSQHSSWLVLRAKHYMNHRTLYNEHYVELN